MKAQLRELITKYDPAVLWFDGEWVDWWTEEDGQDLYDYVRSLKPGILINNRVGKGRKGMEGLSKTDRDIRRRLRHAGAADSRRRAFRASTGKAA